MVYATWPDMVHARGRAGTSAPGERAWLARQGVCSAGVARARQELRARGRARAQNATQRGHERGRSASKYARELKVPVVHGATATRGHRCGMSAVPERDVRESTYAREHAGASALNWAHGPETWA
eukprot:13827564-Alexandrium_andersonii.AAC.1